MKSDLVPITGLWKNKSKNGIDFLSGKTKDGRTLIVFKNKNKRPDKKDPDFNAFWASDETEEKPKSETSEENDFDF